VFALAWAIAGNSAVVALTITGIAVLVGPWGGSTLPASRVRGLPVDWSRRVNRVGVVQSVGIGLAVALLGASNVPLLILRRLLDRRSSLLPAGDGL
jgi:hypothetical protein